MDTNTKNAVKKEIVQWIQSLDDEKLLFVLYDIKERNRKITPQEKEEYNRWLSELEYEPQREAVQSIIASSPDRDAIWGELSPKARENLRTDEEVEVTDIKKTPEQFWDFVCSLWEGEKQSRDDLTEAEKERIEQGLADVEAGRTIPHEEVMAEVDQWLNDRKVTQMKEDIPDLPEDMRAEIADFVLETLNRSK